MTGTSVAEPTTYFGSDNRYRLFTAVKYIVYALLTVNIFMFLQEELLALEHTFVGGIAPGDIIQVFSATIDTAAWVILLLLFELETSVLDDDKIHGLTKWLLHGIRGICYLAIGYAFTGYYAELVTLYQVAELPVADFCSLVGQDFSLMVDIDEYVALTADNCGALAGSVYQLSGFDIVTPADTLQSVHYLGWTDVLNSGAWILVVIVLEIEVRLQLKGNLSDRFMSSTRWFKYVLYSILFAAAFYWGYAGDFIDVWDASLWLFAFIFIELNVFEWQYETTHADAVPQES
jgi:hypothetical protein